MQSSCFGPVSNRDDDALRFGDLATGLASATGGLCHEQVEHHSSHRAHELPLEHQEGQAAPYHHFLT